MRHLKLIISLFLLLFTTFAYSKTVRIAINGIKFVPSDTTVAVGDIIEWYSTSTNNGHTITSKNVPANAQSFDTPFTGSAPTFQYTVQVPGKYEYKCSPHEKLGMVGSFTVTSVTGVDGMDFNEVSLYPNPVKSELNINLNPAETYQVDITDAKGAVKFTSTIFAVKTYVVHAENLTQGLYFVNLRGAREKARTYKFLKE